MKKYRIEFATTDRYENVYFDLQKYYPNRGMWESIIPVYKTAQQCEDILNTILAGEKEVIVVPVEVSMKSYR